MAVPKIVEFDAEEQPVVKGSAPVRKTSSPRQITASPTVGDRIAFILLGACIGYVSFWVSLFLSPITFILPLLFVVALATHWFSTISSREYRVAYLAFGLLGLWVIRWVWSLTMYWSITRWYGWSAFTIASLVVLLASFGYVVWWLVTEQAVRSTPQDRALVDAKGSKTRSVWGQVLYACGGFLSAAVFFIILVVIFVALAFGDVFDRTTDIMFPFALASALLCAGELLLAWRLRARGFTGLFWGVVVGVIASALLAGALMFLIYNFRM